MEEESTSLESKHRKEKKELQAHIQALKKTAKNDKSKKKELVSEIARLEAEMDLRHKQEIESIAKENIKEISDLPIENEFSKLKVSKAQKRRDKKSQQEKEREVEIKQQEIENLHGPRISEMKTINTKLKEKNLSIIQIPSDGDCLYKAVSHQLGAIRDREVSADNLRKLTAHYIRDNKNDFIPFMTNPDTFDMLSDEEFEDYCDKIESSKVWGGQLEIRALSNSLKCPIVVIQATSPYVIEQGSEYEGAPLVITYHRHMYRLGEHYNSTSPSEVVESD